MKGWSLSLLCGLALLGGCAAQQEARQALDQARSDFRALESEHGVLAGAPKDVARAGESLARAERLADFWGSDEDVAHYAYLSQRYADIAREHAAQAREQQEIVRLQLEFERLQLALREVRLEDVRQQNRWLEEELVSLATAETERGLVVTLGDVLFDAGSADLRANASRTTLKLFRFLQLNPQRRIRIEGYTDNLGRAEENLRLSRARAQAVADTLIELGTAAARIEVQGYGEAFPVAANASSRGRAQNRRVEIVFSDAQGQLGPLRQ